MSRRRREERDARDGKRRVIRLQVTMTIVDEAVTGLNVDCMKTASTDEAIIILRSAADGLEKDKQAKERLVENLTKVLEEGTRHQRPNSDTPIIPLS